MNGQISLFDNEEQDYRDLVKTLNYHCDRYYNDDAPEISDHEYDMLNQKLKSIEKEHPEWVTDESPSRRVGWKAEKGVLVKHNVPMLSLQDVFDRSEVDSFVDEVHAGYGEDIEFLVETKIDGLSMALRYENGDLKLAVTRGDGITEGEDVTMNARVISDVVKKMPYPIEYIEIRGEVYMTREAFRAVNEEAEEEGKPIFANPRNCAAGTLRQQDTRITKHRNLSMFIFNVQESRGLTFKTHSDGYDYLRKNGVKTIEHYYRCRTKDEVWDAILAIGNARGELEYDIDGAVVKINDLSVRQKMGNTIKYPRWAIAYKYPPEEKETKLLSVEAATGRTGRVTPVAVFETISLCGTNVSRATLHNQDFIDELGLGIGDTVIVYKSGEIIPKIKGVNKDKRPSDWVPYKMPDVCPSCGGKLIRNGEEADLMCVNLKCPGKIVNSIDNFLSRDCMNCKGFGPEYIRKLVGAGFIKDIGDIFILKDRREELIASKILGLEKNTDKILASIEESRQQAGADRVLAGLGIPGIGKAMSKELIRCFGSIDTIASLSVEELMTAGDTGRITAESVKSFFDEESNRELLERLKSYGLRFEGDMSSRAGNALEGLIFCITGTLEGIDRNEASALIESYGGKVTSSVSKKTNYLLAGEGAGSKAVKAKELGVPVIGLDELKSMLG